MDYIFILFFTIYIFTTTFNASFLRWHKRKQKNTFESDMRRFAVSLVKKVLFKINIGALKTVSRPISRFLAKKQ